VKYEEKKGTYEKFQRVAGSFSGPVMRIRNNKQKIREGSRRRQKKRGRTGREEGGDILRKEEVGNSIPTTGSKVISKRRTKKGGMRTALREKERGTV